MQSGAWQEAGAAPASAQLLDQVMTRLERDYIDSLSRDDMLHRAATGFVKELGDPYSVLLTPDRAKQLDETTSGRYPGVGLALDLRDERVTVIAPLRGTPADSAGIASGDHIVAVNGKTTRGKTMEEVQHELRGRAGTAVTLTVERGGERREVTLTRRMIVYHPVQRTGVSNGIGYVQLATFSEDAARELRRTVDSLRARGARSLILDLRGNPGGLLEQGIEVADLFLDKGQLIVSTRGRTPESDQEFTDEAPQRWPSMPIVTLVDSGTASASEIVAGALQDNGRAALIGSRTYGKGSAQSVFPVTEGYALKLTTARWFTPKGRTIARDSTSARDSTAGGILPDIVVTDTSAMQRAMRILQGVTTPAELRARLPRRR